MQLCGSGSGTAGPHSGNWWAWFGGFLNGTKTAYLRQNLIIPQGSATLSYWLWIGARGSGGDYLDVMIDNTVVAHYTVSSPYPTYTLVTHNVSQFANGAQHQVRFESTTYGNGVTNISVDDVSLCVTLPTPTPTNTPTRTPGASIVKVNNPYGTVQPGDRITYTISYGNVGGVPLSGIAITDTVPSDTILDPGSINPPATVVGNLIRWERPTLVPGAGSQVGFSVVYLTVTPTPMAPPRGLSSSA